MSRRSMRVPIVGLSGRDVLILGAGASWAPLMLLSTNVVGIPHLERILMLIGVVWGIGLGITVAATALGVPRKPAVRAVFLATVLFMSGGALVRRMGQVPAWLLLVSVLIAGAWLFTRLDGDKVLEAVVVATVVGLMSGPVIAVVETALAYGTSEVEGESSLPRVELEERPDIWLVVLDGYPGPVASELDSVGAGGGDLRALGFELVDSAWAGYRATDFSVPSILDLGYPGPATAVNDATLQSLYNVVSGDNQLVEVLGLNGYQTLMIESGASIGNCRHWYDECISSALLDDPVNWVIRQTVLGGIVEQTFGMSYTVGTRKTIEELERLARIDNADPRFVFAHVMAPHPPFYFDEDCGLTVSSRRAGLSFSRKGVPDSERAGYLRDQVECVDSLLVDFASQVPRDDIIVFTSDHGTDRRHQLVTPAEEWDEDDIAERMNAFVAAKLPEGCEVGTSLVLPNLMRRVLACISSDPIPDVEYRIHLGEGVVLSDAETNRLLQMGVAELELAGS